MSQAALSVPALSPVATSAAIAILRAPCRGERQTWALRAAKGEAPSEPVNVELSTSEQRAKLVALLERSRRIGSVLRAYAAGEIGEEERAVRLLAIAKGAP